MENSKDNNKADNHHFGIHASIVFQLGESLISDSVQALVELIKNAYDADSRYAAVTIETSKKNDVPNSLYPDAKGYILIEDGGEGMDDTAIKTGWLTISKSIKREMKKGNKKTNEGRTPLGDKGLGRLGAQRLGNNLEIFTKPKNKNVEYHVAFSWKSFEKKDNLKEVTVDIKQIPPTREKGTSLLISDIKDSNYFKGTDALENLQKELSRMLSPYEEVKGFRVSVKLDGKKIDLSSFSKKTLRGSQIRYDIDFNEENLSIKGKVRLGFIRPQGKKDRPLFKQLVEADNGDSFYDYLSGQPKAESYNLKKSKDGWFVEYQTIKKFKDLDALEYTTNEKGEKVLANPGKFHGKIDSFDLRKEGEGWKDVFDSFSKYKEAIKSVNGIRVYRDGFGIRVDKDWLGLGKQWTSGLSYYGLKLENTLGYIALSADENKDLEETTNREGFKKTPYYNNFYEMLRQFIRFTGEVQEFLRRGWLDFRAMHQETDAKVESGTTPEVLSGRIGKSLSRASAFNTSVGDLKLLLSDKATEAHNTIAHISGLLTGDGERLSDLKNSVELLKKLIKKAGDLADSIGGYLKEIAELEPVEKVLENQIKNLRDQLEQLYETASLGLTAEALSHEVHNIADRLADRTGDIHSYLKGQRKNDPKIFSFVEHVNTSIAALRKQMSHLAPSLKYVREKRDKLDIFRFCRDVAFYHRERLKKDGIDIQVTPKNADNFYVYMNEGKLTQILDNLFLNSDYWLREDLRTGNIRKGRINITINNPFLEFLDNGRGVDPSVETTLFEPFVTTKGKGRGRGLGLFIVQQLLDAEGCTISLLPERNKHDRLYVFEIDFTGGLDER